MLSHIRFAARTLAKTPGLSLSAILLLAFGIGGGTLLFSAFESVWLRPLPVRHPEQLVRVVQRTPQLGSRSYFDLSLAWRIDHHLTMRVGANNLFDTDPPLFAFGGGGAGNGNTYPSTYDTLGRFVFVNLIARL